MERVKAKFLGGGEEVWQEGRGGKDGEARAYSMKERARVCERQRGQVRWVRDAELVRTFF